MRLSLLAPAALLALGLLAIPASALGSWRLGSDVYISLHGDGAMDVIGALLPPGGLNLTRLDLRVSVNNGSLYLAAEAAGRYDGFAGLPHLAFDATVSRGVSIYYASASLVLGTAGLGGFMASFNGDILRGVTGNYTVSGVLSLRGDNETIQDALDRVTPALRAHNFYYTVYLRTPTSAEVTLLGRVNLSSLLASVDPRIADALPQISALDNISIHVKIKAMGYFEASITLTAHLASDSLKVHLARYTDPRGASVEAYLVLSEGSTIRASLAPGGAVRFEARNVRLLGANTPGDALHIIGLIARSQGLNSTAHLSVENARVEPSIAPLDRLHEVTVEPERAGSPEPPATGHVTVVAAIVAAALTAGLLAAARRPG